MDDIDERERDLFLQSIRDSRDEARRYGTVCPEEVERSAEEAIARGLEQRDRDRSAGRRATQHRMRRPSNLSPAADRDIDAVLERSARVFGEAQAGTMQSRLSAECRDIADGVDHGHVRNDIPRDLPVKFVKVGPFPIVYDPVTKAVDRIVDGRRDLPKPLRRCRAAIDNRLFTTLQLRGRLLTPGQPCPPHAPPHAIRRVSPMAPQKFRLVTRSDFDGLVCGLLLRELDLIDDVKFVHPKDMQDGTVPITDRDIVTNLPYVPGCHLAFDHHSSEVTRRGGRVYPNHVIDPAAPSAARVVYDHFGGPAAFPRVSPELMAAVDKADSAQFNHDEILHPTGWVLMNYLMDSRTGLGRFRDFRISNYDLMMQLIERCRDLSVEEVLALPDVKERVDLYAAHRERFVAQLRRCTTVHGKLALIDLRGEDTIFAGNRFTVYALFPQCDVSAHVMWGLRQQNTVFAVGKSILDRGSPVDVGAVCLGHGGGGHRAAGTCQVANERAEAVKAELIAALNAAPPLAAAA